MVPRRDNHSSNAAGSKPGPSRRGEHTIGTESSRCDAAASKSECNVSGEAPQQLGVTATVSSVDQQAIEGAAADQIVEDSCHFTVCPLGNRRRSGRLRPAAPRQLSKCSSTSCGFSTLGLAPAGPPAARERLAGLGTTGQCLLGLSTLGGRRLFAAPLASKAWPNAGRILRRRGDSGIPLKDGRGLR